MAETDHNEAKSDDLAFEEAGRAVDAQERAVNELRSRAGVPDCSSSDHDVVFGSRAITGNGLSLWVWVAVAAFIVVGGCVLTVLWPRSHWSFNASAAEIVAEYIEPEAIEFPLVYRVRRAVGATASSELLDPTGERAPGRLRGQGAVPSPGRSAR